MIDAWQSADFFSIDPAMMRCAGVGQADARMRFYLERPRGHSKTTDLAIVAIWCLAFAARPIRGYAFAADVDQAAILLDAIQRIIQFNPWLRDLLSVSKGMVANTARGHPGNGRYESHGVWYRGIATLQRCNLDPG